MKAMNRKINVLCEKPLAPTKKQVEEFSEKIDITDSFLGQIERGERSLSAKTLKKVVRFTGVSADFLLFNNDQNNKIMELKRDLNNLENEFNLTPCTHCFAKDFIKKLKKILYNKY